jgi:hypothetical protein
VETHRGGHPAGQPPAHEGHTHHTIHHSEDGSEPRVMNHENYNEAESATRSSMGDDEASEVTPDNESEEGEA